MTLQDCLQARAKIVAEMRALTDKATTENRDLLDPESKRFDELKGQLATADKQLDRAKVVQEAERTMAVDPTQPRRGLDGSFEDMCQKFSITRAISAVLAPGQVDAALEFEVSQELTRRSGRTPQGILVPHEVFLERRAVTTGATGGYLYPEIHRGDLLIDRLRAALRVQELGATVLSGLVGDQDIPKLTGSATGYWVQEHNPVTESEQTYGAIMMRPRTVGAMVEYSRRMLLNASPAVEALVRSDLARVLAEAIDNAAINGDGIAKPLGILQTEDIGDVSMSGGPTWAKVLELIAIVETANGLTGSLGWLTHPNAVKTMRSTLREPTADAMGIYVQDAPNALAGYPLRSTTLVPQTGSPATAGSLIFGNWADLLIGYWSAVDILVNPYHSDVYAKGGVKINALQDCETAVRHAESFAASLDLAY